MFSLAFSFVSSSYLISSMVVIFFGTDCLLEFLAFVGACGWDRCGR